MDTGNGGNSVGLPESKSFESELGHCVRNAKGYPRITSGVLRGMYLHRAVWERIAGRKLPEGWQVHHMNGKNCVCGPSLLALQGCLHVAGERRRDPFTGEYMSRDQYLRRYGTIDSGAVNAP
jgi:hypothetical protein